MNLFDDVYFMKQALLEAREAASEGEVPVGAVIVCGDRIIARAHNQTERLNDPTAHAEMLAVTSAQLAVVVYGAPDEKRGFSRYAPQAFHPKTEVRSGILEKECAAEMQAFFRKRR